MGIFLPNSVKKCISVLENAGYEAYCVGGAVRDLIMGVQPSDYDVATNCLPQETEKLFPHTIPTGIKHGTVTVIFDDMPIEVTTYRTEGGYADSRHPDSVNFVDSIKEDLSRRDFTVNAIAYNDKCGIYDPFDGCGDIKKKTLRTVGNAADRFGEDALRILRLFRFASQLGFSIDKDAQKGAKDKLNLLKNVSAERIFVELCKLLSGKHIGMSAPLFNWGGIEFLGIPACDISVLKELACDKTLRFAALIILSGGNYKNIAEKLKADNKLKSDTAAILSLYYGNTPTNRAELKECLNTAGYNNTVRYLELIKVLKKTDCKRLFVELREIVNYCEPYRISDLAVNGDNLKGLGLSGKEIGIKLEFLRREVCKNPTLNQKDTLISLIK